MGDGTGCDNMTAVIVKFKPDFKLSKDQVDLCQENGETPQEASEECDNEHQMLKKIAGSLFRG